MLGKQTWNKHYSQGSALWTPLVCFPVGCELRRRPMEHKHIHWMLRHLECSISSKKGEQGWWVVAHVRIPEAMPHVGWTCCWFPVSALRGFAVGTPAFPSPQHPTSLNSKLIWNGSQRTTLWMCYHWIILYLKKNKSIKIIPPPSNNWRPSSITILCRILVCFFFFVQMSWIFACGLRFNRKSQPCIFFRWFALRFPVKTYAKNSAAPFAVCCRTREAKETYCFPEQWNQRSVL